MPNDDQSPGKTPKEGTQIVSSASGNEVFSSDPQLATTSSAVNNQGLTAEDEILSTIRSVTMREMSEERDFSAVSAAVHSAVTEADNAGTLAIEDLTDQIGVTISHYLQPTKKGNDEDGWN